MKDEIDALYSEFEQKIALTWAHACFQEWLKENPNANGNERVQFFCDCIEGGLSVALKFRNS